MEMPGDGFYGDVLFPLNDPGLQGDVLYAFMGGGLDLKGLQKLYPHRTLCWISTANTQIDFRTVDAGRPVAQQIALPLPAAQRRLVQGSHLVREGMHGSANRA